MTSGRRPRVVALLIAAAGIAVAASRVGKGVGRGHPTAAAIPAHARGFTLGKLAFQRCELGQPHSGATTTAFCAPFQVPENRDAPDGRKIDLHLALLKSEADAADTDLVVFLDGGPGQAATEDYATMAPAFAALRKHHHILLLDQRGTGQSNPLRCKSKEDDKGKSGDEGDGAKGLDLDEVRKRTQRCLDEVEKTADPRYYTTTVAAEDLEAVRQALGAPAFDLVGISYGTRMAQQYAMRHPEGVRSVVLDSVVPNDTFLGEDHARNLEATLKARFAQCTGTPACAKAFGDPYASLYRLRDALRAHPVTYEYRDPTTNAPATKHVDAYTLAGVVRIFAYQPETAALLPLSISEGLEGDFTPLAGQTDLMNGDLGELSESGMQLSVLCSEDASGLAHRPEDDDTLFGNTIVDWTLAACSVWPHGAMPADFHAPLVTDKPLLVLEGELDPVTPPRYGEQVVHGASNGKLIVAPGQGHGMLIRGCIPDIVRRFIDTLEPGKLDTACVDVMGPLPALIDFNGAGP